MTFAAGGHPLPTVLRADGAVEQPGEPGDLLGVLPDARSTDRTVELAAGDTMVLITDGVLDSGQPRLEQDGLDRILRSCRGLASGPIADRVHAAVAADQSDDVAILVQPVG